MINFDIFSKLAICMTVAFVGTSTATATHNSPLYRATDEYRDAVKDFERAVDRSRYMDRAQERIADDLEDASSRLRSAARRPERADRLLRAWNETQYLQRRAEVVIFANPNCPSGLELSASWNRVLYASNLVARHIEFYLRYPAPIYRERPIYDLPGCGYPVYQSRRSDPYRGLHHPSQWNPNRGQPVNPFWTQTSRPDFRSNRVQISHQPSGRQRSVPVGAKLQRDFR